MPPTLEIEAVLTVAPEDDVVLDVDGLDAAAVLELEELLLPHAASSSDAASAGRRNLSKERTVGLLTDMCLVPWNLLLLKTARAAIFFPGR